MPKVIPAGIAWQSHRVAQQVAAAEARKIRRLLFNRSDPPFSTLHAALEWAQQQVPPTWDERAATEQLDQYLASATDALRTISPPPSPWDVRLTFEPLYLMHVPATTEPLRQLTHATDRLAALTGWQKDEAARFILTGAVPRLQSQVGGSITRAGVVRLHLTVFPWQLHPVEWSRLRREVERALSQFARRASTPSTVYRRLLDLIAHLGPPPVSKGQGRAAGRTDYWRRVARAWGQTYRQRRSWNTVWKLYTRLPEQIREEIEKGADRDDEHDAE